MCGGGFGGDAWPFYSRGGRGRAVTPRGAAGTVGRRGPGGAGGAGAVRDQDPRRPPRHHRHLPRRRLALLLEGRAPGARHGAGSGRRGRVRLPRRPAGRAAEPCAAGRGFGRGVRERVWADVGTGERAASAPRTSFGVVPVVAARLCPHGAAPFRRSKSQELRSSSGTGAGSAARIQRGVRLASCRSGCLAAHSAERRCRHGSALKGAAPCAVKARHFGRRLGILARERHVACVAKYTTPVGRCFGEEPAGCGFGDPLCDSRPLEGRSCIVLTNGPP